MQILRKAISQSRSADPTHCQHRAPSPTHPLAEVLQHGASGSTGWGLLLWLLGAETSLAPRVKDRAAVQFRNELQRGPDTHACSFASRKA